MWRRKQRRPPATYEEVRLVAEVLSRFNAHLIEKHFVVSADIAEEFMARLVEERLFGGLQPDGWHYPPIRKLRLRRPRRKATATNKVHVEEDIEDQSASAEDVPRRIDELQQEGN